MTANTRMENLQTIPLSRIFPSPFQARSRFRPEALEELAASIRQQGIIQPVVVRPVGDRYQLIAGERRWRAAQQAGLTEIPAVVREYTDEQALEVGLVENLQRADISIVETARAYQRLTEEFHYTQGEIALRCGKSRVAVNNTLRLLNLPASVLALLDEGELTEGHGRALLALPYASLQEEMAEWIARNAVPVREAETRIRKLLEPGQTPNKISSQPSRDAYVSALCDQLRQRFGTKVEVDYQKGRGSIRLEFYSDEDLERILELLSPD